jgi:Asp-tRNA(Asn)/Glu-tRNA(Gln) amidotransferase B subunit
MSDEYLKGTDLDALKAREEYVEKFKEKIPIIDSPKKMDEFMFEGLRISDEEKDAVLSNKVATKP